MKLIDKAEVIKNIEELDEFWHLSKSPDGQAFIESLLSFLNDIEVTEVDLEEEIKDYIYTLPHAKTGVQNGWRLSWHEDKVMEIAKHFYELGLAQKEK